MYAYFRVLAARFIEYCDDQTGGPRLCASWATSSFLPAGECSKRCRYKASGCFVIIPEKFNHALLRPRSAVALAAGLFPTTH